MPGVVRLRSSSRTSPVRPQRTPLTLGELLASFALSAAEGGIATRWTAPVVRGRTVLLPSQGHAMAIRHLPVRERGATPTTGSRQVQAG